MTTLNKTEAENHRLLDNSFKKHLNLVNFHKNNTEEHEMAKARICYFLKRENRLFITEARFDNGGRADIFDLTNSVAYEVLHSEKEENLQEKQKYYPCLIIGYKAKEILNASVDELQQMLN